MNNTKNERLYELDWLRIIAIVILLFFHSGMFFNTWGWHIKNNELTTSIEPVMAWLHQWRMALLLVISGAGTFFALGLRHPGEFIKKRAKRLLIPLVFGMFVIVPPQIYFEKISQFSSYLTFYPTVFEFVPYPNGSFSWHHLWFVAYLWVYSMILLPLFIFLRSSKSISFQKWVAEKISSGLGFGWIIIIMIACQFILRPLFPNESHDMMDVAYIVHYGLYFLTGYLIYSNRQIRNLLKEKRKQHLILAAITIIFYYLAYFIKYRFHFYHYDFLYHIPATATSVYFILALLGYGQVFLNKGSTMLSQLNEGVYPFYILHQTVTILVAYPLTNNSMNLWGKFFLVNFMTLTICVGIYILFIKPYNIMRLLFGMSPKMQEKKSHLIDTMTVQPD